MNLSNFRLIVFHISQVPDARVPTYTRHCFADDSCQSTKCGDAPENRILATSTAQTALM